MIRVLVEVDFLCQVLEIFLLSERDRNGDALVFFFGRSDALVGLSEFYLLADFAACLRWYIFCRRCMIFFTTGITWAR